MELETAVERLYTDESLAADVDDKTAVPLLKWAESVLPVLVARGDEGFDDAFMTLKKLIKSVARLIDMRGEIDMTERAERAEKIQSFAQELGIIVNIDHLESLASFEGPELVAQMVGPVAAFSAPPPAPNIEDKASSVEAATGEKAAVAPDDMQAQTASDSAVTDNEITVIAPDDKVKAWFAENTTAAIREDVESSTRTPSEPPTDSQVPVLSTELPPEPTPSQAVTADGPVMATEQATLEGPQTPAEKPSLLDGIGAFFQRVAERLDSENNTDHPDDKE
jgi:hypothetical protein